MPRTPEARQADRTQVIDRLGKVRAHVARERDAIAALPAAAQRTPAQRTAARDARKYIDLAQLIIAALGLADADDRNGGGE